MSPFTTCESKSFLRIPAPIPGVPPPLSASCIGLHTIWQLAHQRTKGRWTVLLVRQGTVVSRQIEPNGYHKKINECPDLIFIQGLISTVIPTKRFIYEGLVWHILMAVLVNPTHLDCQRIFKGKLCFLVNPRTKTNQGP